MGKKAQVVNPNQLMLRFSGISAEQREKLVKDVAPMVGKFVNEFCRKNGIKDLSFEYEDIEQTAWMLVYEAASQFDPTRGAKISTFIFLKLLTKFSNLARKHYNNAKRRADFVTIDAEFDEDRTGVQAAIVDELIAQVSTIDVDIDAKKFLRSLPDDERQIAEAYLHYGKTTRELMKETGLDQSGIIQKIDNIRMAAMNSFGGNYGQTLSYAGHY